MEMLSVLLVALVAGVVVPLVFVLVVSGGRLFLGDMALGLAASILSIGLINKVLPHLEWPGSPLATAVAQGLFLALVQRTAITLLVHGRGEDRAAWTGFGFGILESLGVLVPLAPIYHDVLFQGHTLYQLYRKSLYSLFQAVSAMVLSNASMGKFLALLGVQALGYTIVSLEAQGVISLTQVIGNLGFLGILLAPIYLRSLGEK